MLSIFTASRFVKIRYLIGAERVLVQLYKNEYGNPDVQEEMTVEEFCQRPEYSLYHLTAILAAGRKVALTA